MAVDFNAIKGIASNFASSSGGGGFSWGASAGNLLSGIGSAVGNKYGDDFSDDQKKTQSAIRSAIAMIPGYGQIIAAATGAVDALGTMTGTNLSNIDKNSARRAGIGGSATFNNVMNMLPGNSMLWGIWGGRTQGYGVSSDAEELASGYAGTMLDLRAAGDLGNKRLLFGKRKANEFIDTARKNDETLVQINQVNSVKKKSDYYQDLANQNAVKYAGENYLGVTVGRQGLKLMSLDRAKEIIAMRHNPNKLQNGGVIGVDTNVVPEGALHARKNYLAELNPDLEDATKKGIPVMAADGGEVGEQVAEIEHSEIIFRLEVTKQLEELRKDGSEEAMLEAGKLIANELIENTQDNVGMITEEE